MSGLSEEAIRTVESFVSQLRGTPSGLGGTMSFLTYDAWSRALREWAQNHPKREQ